MTIDKAIQIHQELSNLLTLEFKMRSRIRCEVALADFQTIYNSVMGRKDDIIKKLTKSPEGIPQFVDEKLNPLFVKFAEKYAEVLNEEIDSPTQLSLISEDFDGIITGIRIPNLAAWANWE